MTDWRTEGKPIVPSDVNTGKGLIKPSFLLVKIITNSGGFTHTKEASMNTQKTKKIDKDLAKILVLSQSNSKGKGRIGVKLAYIYKINPMWVILGVRPFLPLTGPCPFIILFVIPALTMWRLQHVRGAVHLLSSDVDSRCPPCSFSSRRARCLLSLSLVARSLSMSSRAVLLSGVATISRDFSSIRRSTSDSLDATDKRLWKESNHNIMVSAQVWRIFFKESDKIHYNPPGLFILRSNNSIVF